jgi:hypothetical protein
MHRFAGFPLGWTSGANGWHLDTDNHTVRTWLGLLGPNASTTIIDTSLYGDITIEITLAASDVLMLSPALGTLTSYKSQPNNEVGISTTAGTAPGSKSITRRERERERERERHGQNMMLSMNKSNILL